MERDRERDRDRRPLDIPPEDQYGTGRGQSYRPGGARERTPPPRADTYRARSPPRRNEFGDTYRGSRPRSRTPPRRDDFRRRSPSPQRFRGGGGGDSYRGRPRSPPRREDLPRDDLFRKEPARDFRNERNFRDERDDREYNRDDRHRSYNIVRSPSRARERSPVPLKRGREPSPAGNRDRRASPPVKRERLDSPSRGRFDEYPNSRPQSPPRRRYSPEQRDRRQSPRGAGREFRPRSRSPTIKNERIEQRPGDDWRRPRSRSPQRYARQDYQSAEDSNTTSRRSSPPIHPARMQQVDDRSSIPTPRDVYDSREPVRARSPEPRGAASPPVKRERDYSEERGYASTDERSQTYRGDEQSTPRPPPTGPAGYRAPSFTMAPPSAPSPANAPISAHARSPIAPPSGPRAAAGTPRGDFGASRGRGGFRGDFGGGRGGFGAPPFRGGRGGAPTGPSGYGRGAAAPTGGGRSESFDREGTDSTLTSGAPPSGPRNSFSQTSQAPPPPFRSSSNTTTTTYPRTQRFAPNGQPIPDSNSSNGGTPTGPRAASGRMPERSISGPHPALADLSTPIPGGQRREPLWDSAKLDKLDADAEKLRRVIEEKEGRKRKGVKEWDRLSRETEAASFRSQLAEEALRKGSGEAEGAAAF